jgi:predicted nucleic acid-binding protein
MIEPESAEGQILQWLEAQGRNSPIEVIISEELVDQILRVAKRLRHKNWGGEILGRIWQKFKVDYILLSNADYEQVHNLAVILREDQGVYLTASKGKAQCFISTNHELIRTLVKETGEFECLFPQDFVEQYLRTVDKN